MAKHAMHGSKKSDYAKGKDYDESMRADMSKAMKPMMGKKTPKK